MLVDGPGKLIVQLPRNERHEQREECNDTRDCHEDGLDVQPDQCCRFNVSVGSESSYGGLDLVILNSGIDKHSQVVET